MSWKTLLAILVVVDLIWFIHRMARSYSTAKMILYGVPFYIDCKKSGEYLPKGLTSMHVIVFGCLPTKNYQGFQRVENSGF